MKTAIKLILIDLVIAQITAPILVMIPYTIYLLVTDASNYDSGTIGRTSDDGYLFMESRLYQYAKNNVVSRISRLSVM